MKSSLRSLWSILILLSLAWPALGQGSFQNLDFEAASVSQTQPPGAVNSSDAFPGWTVYASTNQQNLVGFNNPCFGSTCVSLLGTNGSLSFNYKSIEDGFSVLLQGAITSGPGGIFYPSAASIRQTGLVPTGTRSILFKAQPDSLGVLTLSLGGVSIPYFSVSQGPNYTLFGADISSSANQVQELEFSLARILDSGSSNWILDSIEFSTSVVPEPSVLGLSALGVFLIAAVRRSF